MVNYRRKLGLIALVAIVLSLFSHATLAYYTNISTATNVVTSGGIRFLIHETTDQGTPFPESGVYVTPGDVVSKKVNIQSDCTHPFYLRVKLVSRANNQALNAEECLKFLADLCTVSEVKAMAQRLEVAAMLNSGMVYSDIVSKTGASTATISRVNTALTYGEDGYNTILAKLSKKND